MEPYSPEELRIFAETANAIADNAKKMIRDLNKDWSLLGVDDSTRQKRTRDLVKIVQERYDEVIDETREKVKSVTADIHALLSEFTKLKNYLNVNDTSEYERENTLISQQKILEKDVILLRNMVKVRTDKISKLNQWEKNICHRLGCSQKTISLNPLPSEEAVKSFEYYLNEQQQECDKRINMFLEKQSAIKLLLAELEQEVSDSFHCHVVKSSREDFIVTDSNIAKLVVMHDHLVEQLDQRKTEIIEIRERLSLLWERLEEPLSYRSTFLAQYPGHSRTTEKALIKEIERCEEKKRLSIKDFIGKVRKEIEELWESCLYSNLQKDAFVEFNCEDFNEDLLIRHEEYLEKLIMHYNENENLFDLYKERQKLWEKWEELEEKTNQPGRYQNRGGQLLLEEKERKAVACQLPKIEKELNKLAEEYENRAGHTFTIYGHSLVHLMEEDWNKKNMERQCKLSARKHKNIPRTPLSMTKSAPAAHRRLPPKNKETMTAVKRRLSPRNSPHISKVEGNIARRLQFPTTPIGGSTSELNKSKKTKHIVPAIALNGYLMKKKNLARLSQESKERRRARKSQSKSPKKPSRNKDLPDSSMSYSKFEDHLNTNFTIRSSVVPERLLRSHTRATDTVKFQPDGQHMSQKNVKENISPMASGKKRKNFNDSECTPTMKKYKNVNYSMDPALSKHLSIFATPLRPPIKSNKLITRQNTVIHGSPSTITTSQPLRRSNSSHNLRPPTTGSTYFGASPKFQFTSEMRLII